MVAWVEWLIVFAITLFGSMAVNITCKKNYPDNPYMTTKMTGLYDMITGALMLIHSGIKLMQINSAKDDFWYELMDWFGLFERTVIRECETLYIIIMCMGIVFLLTGLVQFIGAFLVENMRIAVHGREAEKLR